MAHMHVDSLLDACDHVDPPVGLHFPAIIYTDFNLLQEVLLGILLTVPLLQHLPQVAHVLCRA